MSDGMQARRPAPLTVPGSARSDAAPLLSGAASGSGVVSGGGWNTASSTATVSGGGALGLTAADRLGLLAAFTYGLSSASIIFVNKLVFNSYNFEAVTFLALCQAATTLAMLYWAHTNKHIELPPLSMDVARRIAPLGICSLANILFALGGLSSINIPMFSALRRLVSLFVMAAEWMVRSHCPSPRAQAGIYIMLFGTLIAAARDLSFDPFGYVMVALNNFVTAFQLVFVSQYKQGLGLDQFGLLLYNTLFSVPAFAMIVLVNGDISRVVSFPGYSFGFACSFVLSCLLAFAVNAATFWCTQVNSPLTTSVTGQIKNFVLTLVGFIAFSDYQYDPLNMLGLFIGLVGSAYYSYVKHEETQAKNKAAKVKAARQAAGRLDDDLEEGRPRTV